MATLQCPLLKTKGELINGRNQTINQITDVKPTEKHWAISFKLYMYHKHKYTHFINKHLHEVHFHKWQVLVNMGGETGVQQSGKNYK